MPLRLAELLVGLSLVSDVGMGLEPGEAARSCVLSARLAESLEPSAASDAYWAGLLQHVGCTAYAHEAAALLGGDEIAVKRAAVRTDFSKPGEVVGSYLRALAPEAAPLVRLRAAGVAVARQRQIVEGYSRANCEVAALTARRIGLGSGVEDALGDMFESWNGSGAPRGLGGESIALPARVARVAAEAALFDRIGGPELAVEAVEQRCGKSLDPDVGKAFCRRAPELLAEPVDADPLIAAVDAEPSPCAFIQDEDALDEVARAFGDAVDLKTPLHHGHSAGVAALAAGAAEALGMGGDMARALRRAGFLHDIGRAAVPNGVWEKPGRLTETDWERVRLHAYHSERILNRSGLDRLAVLAGAHHERLDGTGYHRGSTAGTIPHAARVLAAADAYQAMTQRRAHRDALGPEQAATELRAEAKSRPARSRGGRRRHRGRGRVRPGARPPRARRRPDRSPGRGAPARRPRPVEPRHRSRAGHLPPHRRAPRPGHLREDRRVVPRSGGAVRHAARPIGWVDLPMRGPHGPRNL